MFESHSDFCIPVEFSYYFTTDNWREVLCAAIVLVMVYGLIIFDVSKILLSQATVISNQAVFFLDVSDNES